MDAVTPVFLFVYVATGSATLAKKKVLPTYQNTYDKHSAAH